MTPLKLLSHIAQWLKGTKIAKINMNNCKSRTVVVGKFASVTTCEGCNSYTLYLGPMSFRMEQEIYESLREMILKESNINSNSLRPYNRH